MSDQFLGEIRLFAGYYAPEGWAVCNGQLLSINENDALYSLIGTVYGGDGRTTFALPDLRSRMVVGANPNTAYALGAKAGVETVTLTEANVPAHTHAMAASNADANHATPGGAFPAKPAQTVYGAANAADLVALNTASVTPYGGGNQAHENRQPSLTLTYIIALVGIYPSQS